MRIEAVLLTGGRSTRMGMDKAKLEIEGQPMAERIAGELAQAGCPVTVLGQEALPSYAFVQDDRPGEGPAAALTAFRPSADWVFVASCDLPRFRGTVVSVLAREIGGQDAALPTIGGIPQYLCALYRASAFDLWRAHPARSMRELTERLSKTLLDEDRLGALGIEPSWVRGANTTDEL